MEAALQDERIDLGVAILSNITDLALFGHHRLSSSAVVYGCPINTLWPMSPVCPWGRSIIIPTSS